MRKKTAMLAAMFVLAFVLTSPVLVASPDSIPDRPVKTGWGFGALPAVSFNTDLGFQYGGLVNFYHYGDGSTFPKYRHSIYAEISRYTMPFTMPTGKTTPTPIMLPVCFIGMSARCSGLLPTFRGPSEAGNCDG